MTKVKLDPSATVGGGGGAEKGGNERLLVLIKFHT